MQDRNLMSIADKKYTVPLLQHVIDDKFSLIKNGTNYLLFFYLYIFLLNQVKNVSHNFHYVTV